MFFFTSLNFGKEEKLEVGSRKDYIFLAEEVGRNFMNGSRKLKLRDLKKMEVGSRKCRNINERKKKISKKFLNNSPKLLRLCRYLFS